MLALLDLSRTEPELAVRNGELFAARLAGADGTASQLPPGMREVLRFASRGDLGELRLVREKRRAPRRGEVEIEVRAAGINFRDVLNTLGMVPGAGDELGAECSGVVVATGDEVSGLLPGDEVVALAEDSLASHVTTAAGMVLHKPGGISFAEAVTVPNAFLTAAVSLVDVAKLRAGQRVLVHAAAGGVGLAAVRLARRLGAEVIGTAGSPEKRAIVLAEGAAHAFDSRSASFADDVMRVTGGVGVDCVLNSLAGELIAAGMRVVRRGGCFVEIGKQGIWTEAEAAARAPGVRYVVVDVGQEIARDAAPVRCVFEGLLADLASSALQPLPLRAYALNDAQAAFRTMAAGRHVGKLVLVPPRAANLQVRGDGTYLVTGGLGVSGLRLPSGWHSGAPGNSFCSAGVALAKPIATRSRRCVPSARRSSHLPATSPIQRPCTPCGATHSPRVPRCAASSIRLAPLRTRSLASRTRNASTGSRRARSPVR